MNQEEQFNALWLAYPSDLCNKKRGGKQNALKAFKKINPDEKEFYRMMENMKAQVRADRKEKEPYRWPFVSSYLNQARYDDAIESEIDRKERVDLKTCCIDGCGNDVHGPAFRQCADHVENAHSELLTAAFKKTGLKYGSTNFVNDCRIACRQGMTKMITKSNEHK